jgi:hypothetical protein
MVLKRNNLRVYSQEKIGSELGLTIPKEYAAMFPNARVAKKNDKLLGTRIDIRRFSLNKFFNKFDFPLRYSYFYPTDLIDVKMWVNQNIQNKDILICFNSWKLSGKRYPDAGHVCVLNSIKGDEAFIFDPSPKGSGYRKVKFQKLINAMIYHGRKNLGGFWLLSRNER